MSIKEEEVKKMKSWLEKEVEVEVEVKEEED